MISVEGWNWIESNELYTGTGFSLALGPEAAPYLVYSDWNFDSKATVIKHIDNTWTPVGNPGFSAGEVDNPRIAMAPDGTPFVAFTDKSNAGKITVMKLVSTTTVTGISRQVPAGSWARTQTVTFRASFSEPVSGLKIANFDLNPTVTDARITKVSPVGRAPSRQWDVTVNTGSADGALTPRLVNTTGIKPMLASTLPFADQSYLLDKTAPVTHIGLPSSESNAKGPASFVVTYADTNFADSHLTSADIILNRTGTARATVTVSGTGSTRTVTLDPIYGTGSLGISIATKTATDLAGNRALAAGPSASFIVDNTAPTIVNATSTTADGYYKEGCTINLTLNFSEPVTSTGLTILLNSGATVETGPLAGVMQYSGTYLVADGQNSPDLNIQGINGAISDAFGKIRDNPGVPMGSNIKDSKNIRIDTVLPTLDSNTTLPIVSPADEPRSFSVSYIDKNLSHGEMLINSTQTLANGIGVRYNQVSKTLSLYDDTGTEVKGTCLPGASTVLSNSQGALNCQTTTVSRTANILTVNWNITPAPGFFATIAKRLFLKARDKADNLTPWSLIGRWTIEATGPLQPAANMMSGNDASDRQADVGMSEEVEVVVFENRVAADSVEN